MDFGDILKKWEKKAGNAREEKEEDKGPSCGTSFRGERRYRLLRKKPDDFIDLHGLTRDEAWNALNTFFENSRGKDFEKVLIIHGKGSHQTRPSGDVPLNEDLRPSEGALRDLTRRFIEFCPFAGESGYSTAREGGSGATWVILKERK